MNNSSVTPSSPLLSLETFTEAAKAGQHVYVTVNGEQRQVLGLGSTPQGRSVAWLTPDVDTTSMFTRALEHTYGPGIASAVARELGLMPNPGKALSSRSVEAAVDMANTSRHALSGVDFLSRIGTSSVANTSAFQQACHDVNVDPSTVTTEQRQCLDQAMHVRFEQAYATGQSPVSPATANQWLRELLQQPQRD
ncbi:hypothetical protein [Bordetella tumulicola]|uniref:hypothetical protein n=1 Tax=Bordetella tumulicola TaxID=1649133 RepID=UPI0039EE72E7